MNTCRICGVILKFKHAKTCDDPMCKEAWKNGLTREEQEAEEPYPVGEMNGCQVCGLKFCMCEKEPTRLK